MPPSRPSCSLRTASCSSLAAPRCSQPCCLRCPASARPACYATMAALRVLAFDHEGRPIQFDTWLDDLHLYLLSDSRDSVSLFDHTTAQALYDVVVARYSSPATAALCRLLLPYLFFSFGDGGGGSGGGAGSGGNGSGGGRAGATQRGGSAGGSGSCPYVIRTDDRAGQTCGKPHSQHRCFSRLDDAWRAEFGDKAERPCWAELLRSGVAIFDLDFDAILAATYALSVSAEGYCYLSVPPDPGIEAAALGSTESGSTPLLVLPPLTPDSPVAPPPWSPLLATPSWHALPPPCLWSSQTLYMDMWGSARVSGQGRERYFLPVVDDYTRCTMVFPLRSKGEVPNVLIPWIHAVRLQLRERFREDLPVLRLHSDRGGEFSSDLLRDFCHGEGILQSFTLPASRHQNGIAERRIGLVMEVTRTSMIHAAAPHFLWPFAVQYAAHQLNLWPRGPAPSGVSQVDPLPGTVPVEVAVSSGAARGVASRGAASGSAEPKGAESEGAGSGGAERGGAERGGAEPGGVGFEGAESGSAEPWGTASSGGPVGVSPRLSPGPEPLSPQQLREWFAQRTCLRSGAAGAGVSAAGDPGAEGVGGAAAADLGGARTRGTGAAGSGSVGDDGAGGAGAGDHAEPGGTGAGGTGASGAGADDTGAVGAGARGTSAGGAGA
ncbi:unnamed protein product [Closterium sp. NIES-54]